MTEGDMCEFCEGVVESRHIRARFHYHGQTIYIDNVPAGVCRQCGEQYFDALVYKRLEAIAQHREQIQETICFPLAEYHMAFNEHAQAHS